MIPKGNHVLCHTGGLKSKYGGCLLSIRRSLPQRQLKNCYSIINALVKVHFRIKRLRKVRIKSAFTKNIWGQIKLISVFRLAP